MGFDEGDRVRFSPSGLNTCKPMRSKKNRVGTVFKDPESADEVLVKWDGTKAPSKQDIYHEDWLELAEDD